jgi:hypothetical protein
MMGHAHPHPPPRSGCPAGDLARLLWRRARRHDHALRRESRRGTAVAMALRVLSRVNAGGMQERHGRELRGCARRFGAISETGPHGSMRCGTRDASYRRRCRSCGHAASAARSSTAPRWMGMSMPRTRPLPFGANSRPFNPCSTCTFHGYKGRLG